MIKSKRTVLVIGLVVFLGGFAAMAAQVKKMNTNIGVILPLAKAPHITDLRHEIIALPPA